MTATAQLRAALADRYRIEREIGAGGMATVYLARDLRHDRNVALKVLKPDLGAVVGGERFLSEIRVTANLQHPNLLPLFDSGEADGLLFYVMPYVDGETLRARITREKQLPVDEAVHITTAVASALEYAHEHGVIHRDLKPENILIQAGQPVIADFGIALALSNAGGNRITQTGLSLGTPQYMSPEQATGDRMIDGRTDIYSLGAVLYEMLTGDPPHTASTAQGVIAKVLTDRPRPVRASRPAVPTHVEAAVAHALEKLPADRFHSAQEFADALSGKTVYGAIATPNGERSKVASVIVSPVTVAILGVVIAALAVALLTQPRHANASLPYMQAQLLPPPGYRFEEGANFALSPDGSRLAFVASKGQGLAQALWVRRLDTLGATQLTGTENATAPFWSPDGEKLAFFADGMLKVIPARGGAVKVICAAPAARAGTWGNEDRIVFSWGSATVQGTHLSRALATGGGCGPMSLSDTTHGRLLRPMFLPDGRHLIGTGRIAGSLQNAGALLIIDAANGQTMSVAFDGSNTQFVPPDWLVFSNSTYLEAQHFDPRTFRLSGQPARLLDEITTPGNYASFTVSRTGLLVAASPTGETDRVLWYDRSRGIVADSTLNPFVAPRNTWTIQLSHDGTRTAMGGFRLAAYDLARRAYVDFDVASHARRATSLNPVWSPLDTAIAFTCESTLLCSYHIASSRVDTLYASKDRALIPTSWSPDGRFIILTMQPGDTATNATIGAFSTRDASVQPIVATNGTARAGTLSPDGKLLAYESNETGSVEVYVKPFPSGRSATRVSTAGGRLAAWERNGQALLYLSADGRVMSATLGDGQRVVQERTVLQPSAAGLEARALLVPRDAQRIGLDVPKTSSTLTIVANWPGRLPASGRP